MAGTFLVTAGAGKSYGFIPGFSVPTKPPPKDYGSIGVSPWTPGIIPDGSYGIPSQTPAKTPDAMPKGVQDYIDALPDFLKPGYGKGTLNDWDTWKDPVGTAVNTVVGPIMSKAVWFIGGGLLLVVGLWAMLQPGQRAAIVQGAREGVAAARS